MRQPVAAGQVEVGRVGRHIVLGNDPEAIRAALDAVPSRPGKLAHGLEVFVEPRKLSRALSQVSLLDVMEARELAGIFAAATELGLLLSASERISGWVDSQGADAHRYSLRWTLGPPKAIPPPERPADAGL